MRKTASRAAGPLLCLALLLFSGAFLPALAADRSDPVPRGIGEEPPDFRLVPASLLPDGVSFLVKLNREDVTPGVFVTGASSAPGPGIVETIGGGGIEWKKGRAEYKWVPRGGVLFICHCDEPVGTCHCGFPLPG